MVGNTDETNQREISIVKNTENSALFYHCNTCELDSENIILLVGSAWATLIVIICMNKAMCFFFFSLPHKGKRKIVV